MTPEERYWRRVMARAKSQQRGMDRALLAFLQDVRKRLPPELVLPFIERGDVEGMVRTLLADDVLEHLALPLSEKMFEMTQDNFKYFRRGIPSTGSMSLSFDVQNPHTLDAVRVLDEKVAKTLTRNAQDVVQRYTEQGLREAIGPRVIARNIRDVVGLGPQQLQEVANFRQALIDKDVGKILSYKRRDSRFDSRILRGDYGPEEIEKWTARYTARRVAWLSETVSRTATLDAMKQGEVLTWETAISQGLVKRDHLFKQWVGVLDARERPEHRAMEKQKVPFDAAYSNGEHVPGSSTWNCRCLSKITEEKPPRAPRAKKAANLFASADVPVARIDLSSKVEEIAKRIAHKPYEHAVVLSRDGREVFSKISTRQKSIEFSNAEKTAMKGGLFVHNHPSGFWGPSIEDVGFAMKHDLAGVATVTLEHLSTILRPAEGWSAAEFRKTVRPAYRRLRERTLEELNAQIAAGVLPAHEFNERFHDEIWRRIALELSLDYRSVVRIDDA